MSAHRLRLQQARRWVVKIGSALLTNDGQGLDQQAMAAWVAQMVALKARGIELILVSSGAVAEGMAGLRQALAAAFFRGALAPPAAGAGAATSSRFSRRRVDFPERSRR